MADVRVWSDDGQRIEKRQKVKRYPLFPMVRTRSILESYGYQIKRNYTASLAPFPWEWDIYDKRNNSKTGVLRKETLFGKPIYRDFGLSSIVRTELRDFCNIEKS